MLIENPLVSKLFIAIVLLISSGCCGDCNNPNPYLPFNEVVVDAGGNKYLFVNSNGTSGNDTIYIWDILTNKWVTKVKSPNSGMGYNSALIDTNNPAQNIYVYSSFPPKLLTKINLATGARLNQPIQVNESIISGDTTVVYEGSLVKLHQLTANSLSSLHNLPTLAQINTGLNLNVDITQYALLCTPYKPKSWDYITHYCVMANDVRYPDSSANSLFTNNYNTFLVAINSTGNYSYTPLEINLTQQYTYNIEEQLHQESVSTILAKAPDYAPVINRVPFGDITLNPILDTYGNLDFLYVLRGNPEIHYEYYTPNNPTSPLYTQILP